MDSLLPTLKRVQRSLSLIVWLRGVAVCIAMVVGSLFVLGLVDWSLQSEMPLLRWLASLTFWMMLLFAGYWLRRCWRQLPTLLTTSRLIEHLQGDWHGELVAVSSMLREDMPKTSSVAEPEHVQQRAINRVSERMHLHGPPRIAFKKMLPWLALMLSFVGLLAGCTVAFPAETYLATSRVIWPLKDIRWPRRTQLRLLDHRLQPLSSTHILVHASTATEFFVEDRIGDAPPRIQLEVERNGSINRISIPQQQKRFKTRSQTTGEQTRVVFPIVLSSDFKETRFRAFTNDDRRMSWYTLSQVRPLSVTDWHMTITPPTYLNSPAEVFDIHAGRITAVVGSQVTIHGRTDRPTQHLRLDYQDDQQKQSGGPAFSFTSTVAEGDNILSLRGTPVGEGIAADAVQAEPLRQVQIVGTPDQPPTVSLLAPGASSFTLSAQPTCQFELADDFALNSATLYVATTPYPTAISPSPIDLGSSTNRKLDFPLKIRDLHQRFGDDFELYLAATDHRPAAVPVESSRVPIHVVTAEQKLSELQQLLTDVQQQLTELHRQQQRLFEQAEDIAIRFQETDLLREEDVAGLRLLLDGQTHIHAELGASDSIESNTHSVYRVIRQLEYELELNGLARTSVASLVQLLLEQIQPNLQTSAATAVEAARQLSRISPSLLTANNRDALKATPLKIFQQVDQTQRDILVQLDELLSTFAETQQQIDLLAALDAQIAELQTLRENTIAVAQQTLSIPVEQLPDSLRAELATLSKQHRRFSTKIIEFLQQTDAAKGVEATVREAILQENIPAEFVTIANDLLVNNVSQAVESNVRLLQRLQELRRSLQGDRINVATQLAQGEDVITALQDLHAKQNALREAWSLSELTEPELLTQQQADIRTRFDVIGQSPPCRNHQSRINQIRREMLSLELIENHRNSDEITARFDEIDIGLQRLLADLQQQQQNWKAQSQEQIRHELATLARQFHLRQQQLYNETLALQTEHQRNGRLSRSEKRTLIEIQQRQSQLLRQYQQIPPAFEQTLVFGLATRLIDKDLQAANETLTQTRSDTFATHAQLRAATLLAQLSDCLTDATQMSQSGSTGLQPGEFELLLNLQKRIITREEAVIEMADPPKPIIAEIAAEQQSVNELLQHLLSRQLPEGN